MTKYNIILADPPWNFKAYSAKGEGRSAKQHYSTMTLDNIFALPVQSISADDAVLFLWTTWPHLRNAVNVIDQWGFTYKTNAWVWVKTTRDDRLRINKGYYTRKATEVCLLATRGRPPRVAVNNIPDVIFAMPSQHSAKPFEQYDIIDKLYPNSSEKIELFARHHQPGWDAWGNGVECEDIFGGFYEQH